MPVYVDKAMIPYRGMLMSHMIADTPAELHEMAQTLKLRPEWYQDRGKFPHYDICARNRQICLRNGGIEVSRRELALKMREIREFGAGTEWNLVR